MNQPSEVGRLRGSLSHPPSGEMGCCREGGPPPCRGKDSGQTTARAVRGLWLPSHPYGVDYPGSLVKETAKLRPRMEGKLIKVMPVAATGKGQV